MIKVENLSKKFGAFKAVDDVSFAVREGETFALLGPNGSGKSTTLKCLAGIAIPNAGKISIGDFDVFRQPRESRRLLGYLPQRIGFHDTLTALEVLQFYARLRKLPENRIEEMLHHPEFSFNGFSEKRVAELSGGMIQRLGLAVACLPDAPVLLLDEPTVSLDPEGAIAFRQFLKNLKARGKTVVFSSHVLTDVEELADRVAILVGGKLVALEETEKLRAELARGSRMRITVQNLKTEFAEIAARAGAFAFKIEGQDLLVASKGEDRYRILEALKQSGAIISSFTTEEASLESVYLRYAKGNQNY